jgi:glucose/arabinose dehydrogenase/cytochrome c5|tara:strand:- start:3960 stop:6191 length:2232 start_codon:yes stop_codon:yes gene_type:complete
MKKTNVLSVVILTIMVFSACSKKEYIDKIYEKPEIVREAPSDFLSPEESMKKMYLPEGFKLELVASEPMINEPVAIDWDGNGKMYVAQMETYMQNVDGEGIDEPTSRIMLLEDINGDGKMDKSSVFIDSLLLPRMILALEDRLIVNETYSYNLTSYRDTNGDGVADEKIPVYTHPKKRGGNLEHQQSGLIWNLDNWVYTTYNPMRFRFTDNKLEVDTLESYTRGQWGLTHDDLGHIYYSTAGGENPAYGYQNPPNYGSYDPKGRLAKDFEIPYPIVGTPDVQGGVERRLKPDGTLNRFTGIAGQEIYRGNKLPPSTYGDLFIPEPVGRLIRRAKVKNENGKKVLYNAYENAEFMASTDLNFRPVQAKTGPDGCLYIVDMYRGIIQESNWTREGSKIRPHIVRKNLDKNFGRGRIYRIVHEDIKPDGRPNLLEKSATELLSYLGHANGWYRDTAQKLIILKNDKSVIPLLKEIAKSNESVWTRTFKNSTDYGIERVHALWVLEGLGVVDRKLIVEKLKDEDTRVRITAIRLCETFLKERDTTILEILEPFKIDKDINVVNQLALSLRHSSSKAAMELLKSIQKKHETHEIVSYAATASLKVNDTDLNKFKKIIKSKSNGDKSRALKGYDIYKQVCTTCHGSDLMGVPTGENTLIAPPLIRSARVKGNKEVLIKILLKGLTGPIEGTDYGIMMPMESNDNNWVSNVLSYIRIMNNEDLVSAKEVREIRETTEDKKSYYTTKELFK